MYKFTFPCPKKGTLSPEGLTIPQNPNIPCCSKNHFQEERVSKVPPSLGYTLLHVRALEPVHLKVIPDSDTEVAGEE